MFFIFGINSKREEIGNNISISCPSCDRRGPFRAFVEYSALSIFFIPIFKWNKNYYLESTCCGSLYQVSDEIGRDLERNIRLDLSYSDLKPIYENNSRSYTCPHCGYSAEADHVFCPKCGNRI